MRACCIYIGKTLWLSVCVCVCVMIKGTEHGGCKDLTHAACCVRSMIGIFDIAIDIL